MCTRAAVEGQAGGGVELLDEELREGNAVVGAQGLVAALPVEHQVFIRVGICKASASPIQSVKATSCETLSEFHQRKFKKTTTKLC